VTHFTDEEPTKNHLGRVALRSSAPPREEERPIHDLYELVGKIMASEQSTRQDVQTLTREVRQLTLSLEQDRPAIAKDASTSAAKHTSNRMAILFSALVVIYEQAAPALHWIAELSRGHR